MSADLPSNKCNASEDIDKLMDELTTELTELYTFRDNFFELHTIDDDVAALKSKLVEEKMTDLLKKFEEIDDNDIPIEHRAKFLFMKGRIYNVTQKFDSRSILYLNKAIKLNPRLVDAWNELGECYWKNSNIKEAKNSFESALKQVRDRVTLRSLSIIIRQDATQNFGERKQAVERSVKLAKEAVSQDLTDGMSWLILGNATLCKFFLVAQDPATLRAALSAYKKASQDPVARGQPDLYYNQGTAQRYDEDYNAALECFTKSCLLDPTWETPAAEKAKLVDYLTKADALIRTKGKIKTKKLQQMVQSIDLKFLGQCGETSALKPRALNELNDGDNKETIVVGKVIGSIYTDNLVPFTFALTDATLECVVVNVYNWANGRGVIINDNVTIPEPHVRSHTVIIQDKEIKFRSIRVNNPMSLLVNGKKIGRNQVAGVTVTSTYEVY